MFSFLLGLVLVELTCSVNVQGPIFVDTTWTKAKNPYVIVGDYQVAREVTLTISQGTQIIFNGDTQILIKGNLKIEGSSSNAVKFFSGNSSSSRSMILFKSTNLSLSRISNCQFVGPKPAIQIGQESEHQEDSIKNSGDLSITRLTLNNSRIQTNGYSTGASLTITSANILNSTIVGVYPRSERISIVNSTILSSLINSDAYNDGINIKSSVVKDCRIWIGCCGANVVIDNSRVKALTVSEGMGSPVTGPFSMTGCNVNGLAVSLPAAHVEFKSCKIVNNNNETIKVGSANILCSDISGNQGQVGIEVTSFFGYGSSNFPQQITNSSISKFAIGLFLSGAQLNLTITNTNLYQNTRLNLQNISPRDISAANNWWGKTTVPSIRKTIFDYYKNINYGEVLINNYLIAKLTGNQC